MVESQRSKAFGWLAFSSALLVLLASGVAISRIGDGDGDSRVASAPTTGPTAGAEDGSGAGPAGSSGTGGAGASGPAGASGASDPNAATGGRAGTAKASGGLTTGGTATAAGRRTSGGTGAVQGSSGTSGSAEGTSTGSATSGSETSGSGSGDGAATDQPQDGTGGGSGGGADGDSGQAGQGDGGDSGQGGDGSSGDGQGSTPAPSERPPEQDSRLIAASASAGEGAQGGVIAAGVDGTNLDVDLTLGRDQLVGNHPPSDGTGVSFGGRLLNPPSVSPAFPTVSG